MRARKLIKNVVIEICSIASNEVDENDCALISRKAQDLSKRLVPFFYISENETSDEYESLEYIFVR